MELICIFRKLNSQFKRVRRKMKLLKNALIAAGVFIMGWTVAAVIHNNIRPNTVKAAPHEKIYVKKNSTTEETVKKVVEPVKSEAKSNPESNITVSPVQGGQYITAADLNVRAGSSTKYPILGVIKQGEALSVQAKLSNGWYQVSYHGKKGYVNGEYVARKNSTAVYKMNIPVVLQNPELPTGCEVTSLTMALNYKGIKVDKITLAKQMPYTTTFDPNKGFVGSPFKKSGETINPVKLQELAKVYRSKSADLTGVGIATIEQEVRAGNPVLVWYTIGYVEPKDEYLSRNGHKYWYPQPLHCIVVTGASSTSFFINDPLNGNKNYPIDKDRFNHIYTKMGKRALVVR
jgi:uncharacterized protein YvpB